MSVEIARGGREGQLRRHLAKEEQREAGRRKRDGEKEPVKDRSQRLGCY
jgi:hypothetical protein